MIHISRCIINVFILLIGFNLFSCKGNVHNQDESKRNPTTYGRFPIGKMSKFESDTGVGYKDEKGNIIVHPVYNQLPDYPWEFMNVKSDGDYGLINYLGDTIIEFGKYQLLRIEHSLPFNRGPDKNGIQFFSDSVRWNWVCQKNDLFGMIDRNEKILIPIEFEKYEYIFSNKYAFYKNGKGTIYTSEGQLFIPQQFDEISQLILGKYFIYKNDNRQGVFNVETKKDVLGQHEKIFWLEKVVIGAGDNNKFKLYNLEGDLVSDVSFDTIFYNIKINAPVSESHLSKYKDQDIIGWASLREKHFLINETGEVIEIR